MKRTAMEIFSVAGLIGLSLVAAAIFGYIWMIVRGEPVNAPDWLVMLVTLVVKHFYDAASKDKESERNGSNGGDNARH